MTTPKDQLPHDQPAAGEDQFPQGITIAAEQLFGGKREVCIEHEGVRYRLRITRRNKLILQK